MIIIWNGKYGERGLGWDYWSLKELRTYLGGDARYIVNSLTEDQNAEIGKGHDDGRTAG